MTRDQSKRERMREEIAALFRHAPGEERPGNRTPGEIADLVLDAVWPEVEHAQQDAESWHKAYQDFVSGTDEFLGDLLELLPGAEDTGMDAWDQIPRAVKALRAELDDAQATIEQVRQRHRPHDCRDHIKASTPVPCVNAGSCRCGSTLPCTELEGYGVSAAKEERDLSSPGGAS